MTEAAAVPMFYFCDEVHLDALAAARAAARADPSAAGLKLTFLPFVIKALSLALARCAGAAGGAAEGAEGVAVVAGPVAKPGPFAAPCIYNSIGISSTMATCRSCKPAPCNASGAMPPSPSTTVHTAPQHTRT